MNRRLVLKSALKLVALSAIAPAIFLTACNDQQTISALLSEMSSAWTAFESALGKTVPTAITNAFVQAINAVNGWVKGTAAQDVVEILQDLASSISSFVGTAGLTGLEAAAASIILGMVANIIELIDPHAVPPIAGVTLKALAKAAGSQAPPQKHFRQGEIPASKLKSQFELEWQSVTGKAA